MSYVTVQIYGASDDLVEIEGDVEGADEYNAYDEGFQGVIEAPDGGTAILYVEYRDNGCWTATLGRYEEGYAIPSEWGVELSTNSELCAYSTVLTLTLPAGSTIRRIKKR